MRVELIDGEIVEVNPGDRVYVDQGDSVGCVDYRATVVDVLAGNRFDGPILLLRDAQGEFRQPVNDIVDLQVVDA